MINKTFATNAFNYFKFYNFFGRLSYFITIFFKFSVRFVYLHFYVYFYLFLASSGFTCNTMGNLNCGDTPIRCRGLGVIDCTKACPGSMIIK